VGRVILHEEHDTGSVFCRESKRASLALELNIESQERKLVKLLPTNLNRSAAACKI